MTISSIELKVVAFDEASNSVIVAFRENGSDIPFESQPTYAYQPYNFGVTTIEELVTEIAKTGVSIVDQAKKSQEFSNNAQQIADIKSIIGSTYTKDVADLFTANNTAPLVG